MILRHILAVTLSFARGIGWGLSRRVLKGIFGA